KQLVLASQSMGSAHNNLIPSALGTHPAGPGPNTAFVYLMPSFEEGNAYASMMAGGTAPPLKILWAPLDKSNPGNDASTSYVANANVLAGSTGDRLQTMFYTKGSSNCIVFFERPASENGPYYGSTITTTAMAAAAASGTTTGTTTTTGAVATVT